MTLLPDDRGAKVLELRARSADRTQARALASVHRQLREARAAIDAVLEGDVDQVWTAHMLTNRAMVLTDTHRLRTTA